MTPSRPLKISALTLALIAVPGLASAHCGTMEQGSFTVSCEQGVKVYRHNAPDYRVSAQRDAAALERAKLRQKTAREGFATQRAIASERSDLRRRELATQDYRARIYERNTRGRSYGTGFGGYGFGYGGYRLARPITVGPKH